MTHRNYETNPWVAAFCILLITGCLQPWRSSVAQDDATYAAQAIQFAAGGFRFHPDSHAFLLPQTVMGATAIRIFSFLNPLRVLNSLTWLVFLGFAVGIRQGLRLNLTLWLSFLAIPFWFQYGASFLYDMWAVALLSLLLGFLDKSETPRTLLGAGVLSALVLLQAQTLAIFPALYGVQCWIQKRRLMALAMWTGLGLGIGLYLSLDQSLSQKVLPTWLTVHHQGFLDFIATLIQLICGLGFFLLPWVRNISDWSRTRFLVAVASHLFLILLLWLSPVHVLAGGVFFSDYLPRVVAAFISSLGIWGWIGTTDLFRLSKWKEFWPSFLGVLVVFFAYSWRGAADLRYALVAVPVVLLWIHKEGLQKRRLGSNSLLVVLAVVASLFLNLYSLDTTEARWKVAQELEAQGIDPREISAGYGRDSFVLEWSCVSKQLEKWGNPKPNDPRVRDDLFAYIPRFYEKGWNPKFLIKPSRFFGKKMSLIAHRMNAQNQEPIRTIQYSSAGFVHELGLFQADNFTLAECFRQE